MRRRQRENPNGNKKKDLIILTRLGYFARYDTKCKQTKKKDLKVGSYYEYFFIKRIRFLFITRVNFIHLMMFF